MNKDVPTLSQKEHRQVLTFTVSIVGVACSSSESLMGSSKLFATTSISTTKNVYRMH